MPITGHPAIDQLFPPEKRKQFNRKMYYKHLPATFWSGLLDKNPVDREFLGAIVRHLHDTGRGAADSFGERVRKSGIYSLKSLLQKQTLGRALSSIKDIAPESFVEAVQDIKVPEGMSFTKEDFDSSKAYAAAQDLISTLDPGVLEDRSRLLNDIANVLRYRYATNEQSTDAPTQDLEPQQPPALRPKVHLPGIW